MSVLDLDILSQECSSEDGLGPKFYEKKGMCFLLEEKNISKDLYKLISTNFKDNTKFNSIILNQRQYSDKDVFNKLNFNIEKIINEKN